MHLVPQCIPNNKTAKNIGTLGYLQVPPRQFCVSRKPQDLGCPLFTSSSLLFILKLRPITLTPCSCQ